MVCEQTCSCGNEMDKSLWQTLSAFDLLHSSCRAVLFCGKHSTTMQTWLVSRLWFCKRPWRFQVNIRRNSCAFSEVTRLCQKVRCARKRLQFYIVPQKLKLFLSMQVHAWMEFPLLIFGVWWSMFFIPYRAEQMDPRESHGEARRQLSSQTCMTPSQSSTPTSFQQTLITSHQMQRILVPMLRCMSLRTMRQ